jgi:TonB family protein
MTKNLTLLLLSLLFFQTVKAQKATDTVITYFKNTGEIVNNKDSADYIRMVLPPDTATNKNLYRVFEFYPSGKHKSVSTSITGPFFITLDGTSISYFPNGVRKNITQYKNGKIVDDITTYYPNGKLYMILRADYDGFYYPQITGYPQLTGMELVECRDSTGVVLASNGNGHFLIFNKYYSTVIEEGNVINGKRDGEWRGLIADSGRYICTYHKNILKSGISYIRSGHSYPFKEFLVKPTFDGGNDNFKVFIKKIMIYPDFAKEHNLSGLVLLSFTVKTDGTLSDIKVIRGDIPCLNEEALRIMRFSPMWSPGMQYGFPVTMNQEASINF